MYFLVISKLAIELQQTTHIDECPSFIFNVNSERIVINYLKAFIRDSLNRFGRILLPYSVDLVPKSLKRLIQSSCYKLKPITRKNVRLIFDIKEINIETYNRYKEKSYFYKPNVRRLYYGNYYIT